MTSISSLVDSLRRYRLLEPAQLEEVAGGLHARFPDPKALARELLQRGWLTAYQVNHLLQGKGHELVLGQYILLERLGAGGMGQVLKARHASLGRLVAVKLIRKERLANPDAIRRFQREVRAAAKLDHPHIVRAIDADEVAGTHFFVMEYVAGTDLKKLVKAHGPLPIEQACDFIRQAALGLQHAFEQGLVHRDIKPANLFLVSGGVVSGGVVKILDMGLARIDAVAGEDSTTLTQEGSVMGTPDYIAPEQARSSHEVDIRADLYSLGCSLYFLLTGKVPFPGGTMTEKLLKHQWDAPRPIWELRPEVPEALAGILHGLLAKRPEDRFQTPAVLAKALENFLAGTTATTETSVTLASTRSTEETFAANVVDSAADDPFANLGTGQTRALTPAKAPTVKAAPTDYRVLAGVVAGLLVAISLVVLTVMHFSAGQEPDRDKIAAPEQQKTPQELALEDEQRQQAEEKKRLTDETEARKKRAADAQAAFPALKAKFDEKGVRFLSFAKEVQAFKAKHGGTPAAIKAAELLIKLPSPLDQLDPKTLPDDAKAAWKAAGMQMPKELVAVLGEHRRRHWGGVLAIAFAPNGSVVSVGGDQTARRWNPSTGQEQIAKLDVGPAPPGKAVLSPDGQTVALGGNGYHTAKLWDTASGKDRPMREGSPPPGDWVSYALSSDGRTLVGVAYGTASEDEYKNKTLLMSWDQASGKKKHELVIPIGWPSWHPVAIMCDGRTAFLSLTATRTEKGQNQAVKRIDLGTGQEQILIKESALLALSADEQTLAMAAGQIILWDTTRNKERITFAGAGPVAFSPDNQLLATSDGKLVEVATGKVRTTLPADGIPGFSRDGKQLASGGADGAVRLWDFESGDELQPLKGHVGKVNSVAFSPDDCYLLTGGVDKKMRLWDVPSTKELRDFEHQGEVHSMAMSPDGNLAVSCDDERVRLWDVKETKPVEEQNFANGARRLAIAQDGTTLACALTDGTIELWSLAGTEAKPRAGLMRHEAVVTLAFSADGRLLASGGNDHKVRLWDLTGGEPRERAALGGIKEGAPNVVALAFAPDGKTLASGHTNPAIVQLRDLSGPVPEQGPTLQGHANYVYAIAFAPDGKTLVSADLGGKVIVWDRASAKKLRHWQLAGPVYNLAFANDGRHVATANANGTVYVLRLPRR